MMQLAVSVCASLVLVGLLLGPGGGGPSTAAVVLPTKGPVFEVTGDGVDAKLPSSTTVPRSTFGTPLQGASAAPSAASYTHTMFDP